MEQATGIRGEGLTKSLMCLFGHYSFTARNVDHGKLPVLRRLKLILPPFPINLFASFRELIRRGEKRWGCHKGIIPQTGRHTAGDHLTSAPTTGIMVEGASPITVRRHKAQRMISPYM